MHGQYHLEWLLFSAQCEHPAIEATILDFCDQIDEELKKGTVILSNLSNEGMDIDIGAYKIPLPPQVDRRKIQAKKRYYIRKAYLPLP